MIGGPLAFVAATGALFDVYDQNSGAQFLLTVPEIVWEASLGIYLIVKGFTAAGLAALDRPPVPDAPRSAALAAPAS